MCSVLDGGDIVPESKIKSLSRKCLKCDQPPVVVIRANDAYCKDCFLSYCIHKFRMSFGKSRLIRDQEKVILALSGGNSSCAMLHLVQEGKSERAQRKLRFLPILTHIDESCVYGSEGHAVNLEKIVGVMGDSGYKYAVYKLSQVLLDGDLHPVISNTGDEFDKTPTDTDQSLGAEDLVISERLRQMCVSDGNDTRLKTMIEQAKSLTAKQSLLANLRQELLGRICSNHGCSKVLLGDSCTRLAVHMLSNITQGRGSQLSYEMSFADTRREDMMFVRPMREFSSKEVSMYNALNKVETVFMENLSTKAPVGSSLDRLTEEFITGLQADFPNTTSTIFRTGEKLDVADKSQDDIILNCCMCQAPLDTDVGESSALSATLFSQKLCNTRVDSTGHISAHQSSCNSSTNQNPGDRAGLANDCDCKKSDETGSTECCGEGDGSCHTAGTRLSIEQVNSSLCYGCRLVVKDMSDYTMLPPYVLLAVGKHIRRKEMKADIQDFLLEDEG